MGRDVRGGVSGEGCQGGTSGSGRGGLSTESQQDRVESRIFGPSPSRPKGWSRTRTVDFSGLSDFKDPQNGLTGTASVTLVKT